LLAARPADTDVVSHMAEGGAQSSRGVSKQLCTSEYWVLAVSSQPQHTADCGCLSGAREGAEVSESFELSKQEEPVSKLLVSVRPSPDSANFYRHCIMPLENTSSYYI
jgi:hypothetical protein